MALVELIVIIVVLFLIEQSRTAKSNKKVNEMVKNGAFLEQSWPRFHMIYSDMYDDWNGERKLYPKEYWTYMERNNKAVGAYAGALASQQEIKEGRRPSLCIGTYNKNTYDPFGMFNSQYTEKIKIFNETGKFYL